MAKKVSAPVVNPGPEMQVSLNLDSTPILYTDSISMTANQLGVTLDVMQRVGTTNQVRVVARIGMSREHAERFVAELGKLLISSEGQSGGQTQRLVN
ncbi:hypothetical protein M1563_04435 [Patescibacteria group bacterium]|nr:hypothetical protein [Patescibacteria group bacterium]MCL5409842.1 hypothetical protein [Patescibacteria group bacterium]